MNYSNGILSEIERKRQKSEAIIIGFMLSDFNDEERWNFIEDYFLGRDDEVAATISL